MRRQTVQNTRPKIKIPGISVIIIVIIFAVLGFKALSYVSEFFAERQGAEASQAKVSNRNVRSGKTSSSTGVIAGRNLAYYQMITEKNLLRPLGWEKPVEIPRIEKPVIQRERPRERSAPVDELVLTGILNLDDSPIALVEDVSNGKAYFLREGDRLKNYSVEAIAEENIVLANENSKRTHALGVKVQYSSNRQISMSERPDTTNDTVQNANAKKSQDEDTENMSLIERMKARRRRELGQ